MARFNSTTGRVPFFSAATQAWKAVPLVVPVAMKHRAASLGKEAADSSNILSAISSAIVRRHCVEKKKTQTAVTGANMATDNGSGPISLKLQSSHSGFFLFTSDLKLRDKLHRGGARERPDSRIRRPGEQSGTRRRRQVALHLHSGSERSAECWWTRVCCNILQNKGLCRKESRLELLTFEPLGGVKKHSQIARACSITPR